MSLINEALKKAQPERPDTPHHPKHLETPPMKHQPPPKRKRSYLWGFLLAVLIVALVSALLSTFLVYQILGDEDKPVANSESSEVESSPPSADQVWEKLPDEVAAAESSTGASSPKEVAAPAAGKPATASERTREAVDPDPVVQEEIPKPPAKPNPAVWARLQELEIRGIMSGGEKVLVFDTSTGKSKSYEPGDIVDGTLSLKISSIESDAILFEDYGGIIHTKSF